MSYPPPPPPDADPQPRRRRRWPIILAVVLAGLLLCCGGSGYGIYRLVTTVSEPARDAATNFVEMLERGDVDAAYESLCPRTKEAYSPQKFSDFVEKQKKITGHSLLGFSVENPGHGSGLATVTMRLSYADGTQVRHVFALEKDGNTYRVCGEPF